MAVDAHLKTHKARFICHTIINVAIIAIIVCLYYLMGENDAVNALNGSIIYRLDDQSRVGLECVVAWDSEYVNDILEILDRENVRITFVVSGTWAKDNADILQEMVKKGHEIATCAMNYSDTGSLGTAGLAESIEKSVKTIEALSNAEVKYYYCPVSDTAKAKRAAERANIDCVRCTVDLLSARGDESLITKRAGMSAKGAGIIAFTPTVSMTRALPDVIKVYKDASLFVTPVMYDSYN